MWVERERKFNVCIKNINLELDNLNMNLGSATYCLGLEIWIKLPNVKKVKSHSRLRERKKAKIGNCLALTEDSK